MYICIYVYVYMYICIYVYMYMYVCFFETTSIAIFLHSPDNIVPDLISCICICIYVYMIYVLIIDFLSELKEASMSKNLKSHLRATKNRD